MMDLKNQGLISFLSRNDRQAGSPRTLIVSGVARSGTSMVARILAGAGVFIGAEMDDIVFEDHAFARLFEHPDFDRARLQQIIKIRNGQHRVWGFKRPHLHVHGSDVIAMFRNPMVILTVRDPVAIAERNAIAEQRESIHGLTSAINDLQDMVRFAEALTCPILLVSYEKAIRNPEHFVEQLLRFCDIDPSASRHDLHSLVEPDRPAYIESARRTFDGYVDNIQGFILSGWAHQKDVSLPVPITLFRDGLAVKDGMADLLREDLLQAGIGNGEHGFRIDLRGLGIKSESSLAVRIGGRSFELKNSGRTAAELCDGETSLALS